MSILTVRNLDPTVQAKLRQRAAEHGRSMEAEARAILAAGVEADTEFDLVGAVREHFADAEWEGIESPDRSDQMPRVVTFEDDE